MFNHLHDEDRRFLFKWFAALWLMAVVISIIVGFAITTTTGGDGGVGIPQLGPTPQENGSEVVEGPAEGETSDDPNGKEKTW